MITVNAKTLRAFLAFGAEDDIRYYLNGIYIDAEHKVLVATNGHIMAAWQPDAPDAFADMHNTIVPRAALESALKLAGSRKDATVEFRPLATIASANGVVDYVPVDGRFPAWRDVVPGYSKYLKRDAEGQPQFNAEYLARCQKFLTSITAQWDKDPAAHAHVQTFGADYAALVTRNDVDNAFCVVMPCRSDPSKEAVTRLMHVPAKLEVAA